MGRAPLLPFAPRAGWCRSCFRVGARVGSVEVKVPVTRNLGVSNSWARPTSWSKAGRVVAIGCALAVGGCSSLKPKPKLKLAYEERPVELLYSTGADRMDHHQWGQ